MMWDINVLKKIIIVCLLLTGFWFGDYDPQAVQRYQERPLRYIKFDMPQDYVINWGDKNLETTLEFILANRKVWII